MAVDPDLIPSHSSAKNNALSSLPKWGLFTVFGLGALTVVSFLKMLFPLILMGLALAFIWQRSRNY